MTLVRNLSSIAALTIATLATSAWAATDGQPGGLPFSSTSAVQVAQATTGSPEMGLGGKSTTPVYADQMQAMQEMHHKMQAASTPAERKVLMVEQMRVMRNGMSMMAGMGGGAMMGKTGDTAAQQGTPEQRMDMMESMMQMMMDRMQSAPVAQ